MRVLIAFTDNDSHNPFVKELEKGLEEVGCRVTWSLDRFWAMEGSYDIIHIQWPEYLFPPFEPLTEAKLSTLERVLVYWKAKARVVLTRHNAHPNYKDSPLLYERLYQLVYSYCDAIVHLGPDKLSEFKGSHFKDIYHNEILHQIIPHHLYNDSYENIISQSDARKLLGISSRPLVVLIFGRIRYTEERRFLRKLFANVKGEDILFLIPSWLPFHKGSGIKCYLRSAYYFIRLAVLNLNKRIRASDRFISDDEVQVYFNAADIVLLPRIDGLNSGNITLSYYFRKVILGPDTGNMAFELKEFGNPVYQVGSIDSLLEGLAFAKQLVFQNKGQENYENALKCRSSHIIGGHYVSLYQELLSSRKDALGYN